MERIKLETLERSTELIRECEWRAMKYLANKKPKKYALHLGTDKIHLVDIKGFSQEIVYSIDILGTK